MAGKYFYKVLFVFIFIIKLTLSYKLNVPRILLPIFNDFSSKFVLEATEGGCYKWTTTRSDVITLTQIDADSDFCCSSKVIVSSITKEFARNIAVVLAEDVHTKRILRCDVIVDVIDNLEIVTTTRELFMEEAPEVFEVRAYDDQGNEFTSLEGVEFDWNIMCLGTNPDVEVLKFITFSESPYETPPTVQEIEGENKQGHIVLLEGVKTGAAKVSANLPQLEYKHIKPCSIQLSVIANLLILPADAYIMVGDTVTFQIIHMNNGQMEVIELPDAQFYLEVENKELGTSEKETGQITGLAEGKTRVVLHDRNVNEDDPSFKLPAATLNIVAPAYMVLSCMPHRNWAILKSIHHDIIVEVFSSNDNKIYIGSGAQVHTQVGDSFHVQERSQNGSWLTGWGIELGNVPVQAVLESVIHPTLGMFKIEREITAQAQLQVYSPIILTPCEVVLPWDPQRRPKYEKQVRATGGDGKFLWSSSNHSVGVVTQSGMVRTHTSGYFEVSAAMMRNHHNRETAVFLILIPTRLEIVEFIMEAEIGSVIYIHVALYADKYSKDNEQPSQIPFTGCQELPFDVKFSDPSFSNNKSAVIPPVGISCANIAIIGTKVAISTVTISYTIEDKLLEDTVTISTFKPLKVIKPNVCEIVLAVGTSISVLFSGGPQIIPGKQFLHKRTISIADETKVSASEESAENPDEILLNVVCLQLGESSVLLSVSNTPSLPNSKNQESCASVKVICSEPKSLSLQPETQAANTEGCPMDLSSSRIVIHSYKDVELDVIVLDDQGRPFLNISSLKFNWKVNPDQLGELKNSDGVFAKTVTEKGIVFTNKTYQIVSPRSQTGSMEVSAEIVSYKPEELIAQGISSEVQNLQKSVTAAIHLFLVDDTVVTPNSVSVFNHPGNRKLVAVSQGSGYFEMALSADNIAHVKYIDATRQIEIVPIKDGHLRITLIDLCLSSQPSFIEANIVSVSIIRVEMSDKVEIGRCIACIVKLYDENDNLLCVPDLSMVNVEHHLQREIAKIKKVKEDPSNPWGPGEIHYIITGIELGESKLSFSIGETSSAPIELQVFSPLKITPRNTTLIVGSILQFSNKGGPLPDCNVEYASENIDIADVNIAGLVQAKALGHSQITARAVGINPTTGLKIVYSQDTVDLDVVPLTGIKIGAPLMRFQVGTTVPAWGTGLPEHLTPIILGTVDPPIRFEWKVDDEQVLDVHGLFKEHGIEYSSEDDISVRLTGIAPGVTKVYLDAIVPGATAGNGNSEEVVYSTSIDVEVFERLTVVNPNNIVGSFLLMAPHCTIQIETNLDETNKLTYSLPGPEPPSDPDNRKSLTLPNSIVTLSSSGLLRSQGAFGKTMILVTALDEYGLKQTLSVIVEVKPVHYMLLNVIASWKVENPPTLKTLPLGTEFQLRVSYHDNTGAQFTAGTAELGIRSSRFDLAKIRAGVDNSTVYVALKKPGSTMIKVWADGYHKTADYVKLRVGQSLSPNAGQLNTGDIICACTSVVSTTDLQGSWSSSDRNLLSINAQTGVGHVEGVRSGSVSIGHSLHPSASLQVQVVPSNQITMLPVSDEPLINSRDAPVYKVPLVLSNEQNPTKTSNVVCECSCEVEMDDNADYPFTCHLEFVGGSCTVKANDVFRVAPGFDSSKGQYSCNILPGTVTSAAISVTKGNVAVWAQLVGGSVQAAPVEVKFIPAIFVEPELYLDNEEGTLSVHGLDFVLAEVTVEPADSSLFKVESPDRSKANVLDFKVLLLDYHWKLDELGEPMNLVITSKVTKEVVNVHVKTGSPSQTKIRTSRCSVQSGRSSSMDDTEYTLIILTGMMAMLILIYITYSYCFQPVVNVNVTPDRSMLQGSANGSPRSSFNSGQCAYVQYMRRTSQGAAGSSPRNRASCSREPVYGDPSSFYATSPEARRNNRSFM